MKELLTQWFGKWIVDPEVLHAYRTKIPNKVTIDFDKSDGKVLIRVTSIDDQPIPEKALLVTEADSEEDVIPMVNDLIMAYEDVPLAYRPYFEKELSLTGALNKNQSTLVKV